MDGNEYIDYLLGSGPMILGHAHPAVTRAVQEQLALGTQLFEVTEATLGHARKVLGAVPCGEKIKYQNTGNEATYLALRLARAYTGKSKILKFEGALHGTHDYTAWSTTPSRLLPFPQAEPDSAGIPLALGEHVLIAPFNDADTTCQLVREHSDDLAAVIVEPLMRTIKPRPGFLEALRRCTREAGVLLVFDEIVTGFRLAWGGAQEFYGVEPDIAVLGKIIGGGLPIGALVGPEEIMSRLDPAFRSRGQYALGSGTFTANALSTTAGLAALQELEEPGVYQRLHSAAERLRKGFEEVCRVLEVPALVVNEGPVLDVMMTEQAEVVDYRSSLSRDRALEGRLTVELVRHGVLVGGHKWYISLAHSDEDLDRTVDLFEAALRAVRSDGGKTAKKL